ncbi:hypothetical protein [Streptomyces griseus]|uniref:hypothetical protein n=1 Tax=Streptomyces griseus TaxID=1911 RepID=UPI00364B8A95
MTIAERHLQTFARQQLGHVPVESAELYIHADATAADEYIESGTITAAGTRSDDQGEVTP